MELKALAIAALALASACNGDAGRNEIVANGTPAAAPPTPENAAGTSATAAAANAATAAAMLDPGPAHVGRCHMDGCSWSMIERHELVRREAAGSLHRLSVLGGSSSHPGGNYPEDARHARIAWNRAPHEVFIFCSRRLSAVMIRTEGALQTDVLDFVNGPYGYQESGANLYVSVCHPGDDWASNGFAERFGYEGREEPLEINLAGPEEIFDHAR